MAFIGKEYKFERQENFEDFVNALGLPPAEVATYINYHPSVKVKQDGDNYTLITSSPAATKEVSFQSGVAFDDEVSGRTCKTAFTVADNQVTQVQNFEDGTLLAISREFNGNELVTTFKTSKWDGEARRYYKA